ncbi:Peptidoglycan-binding (PGRP) domain of peptidoglycan hydrolases (PGRP) [Fructobacillus cardui]|uniref:Peptidoglycan-binding (PGRP) domain of peptidoglycan hydrolases (PGRP) n=1 Tax=Fructobacillus cardui TaxID=2893170 RepID=A0ABM9N2K8_9LACO|nr:Peptidoglycan-binding (PGRP) domain of peptidoglycan hydrolases (PGRP) [Fructobacillus cardui]
MMNKFTAGLESGYVTINTELTKGSLYINHVSVEISDEKIKQQNATFSNQDVIVFDIDFNWVNTQKELVKNLTNPIDITMQKTSQAMLTLIQGGLSLNNQVAYGLRSAITSVLDATNQLPSDAMEKITIYGVVMVIFAYSFGFLAGL